MITVTFTKHALERWRERLGPDFEIRSATRLVLESRQATKRERRRRARGTKTVHRLSTAREIQACRVHDAAGLMFFLHINKGQVSVKTVVKLDADPNH